MEISAQQMAFVAKHWRDLIRPRELVIEHRTAEHLRVSCEPLERGFGTTLGVMLRRALLMLPGAAITHIGFRGEPPVDLFDLALAFREVAFTTERADPATVRLDKHGGCVTAGDIALVDGVICRNPELGICVLGEARLAIDLVVATGRGYAPAERHAEERPGMLAIDALFAPIRQVTFRVTPARVGHKTDYDRLELEVRTNGTLDPIDAVSRAARTLQDRLGLFLNFDEAPEPKPVPRDRELERIDENLWRTIDELELSVRATNCLRNLKITYIGELVQKTEAELMKSRGFGRKSLTEIAAVLDEMRLHLGMKLDIWPKSKPAGGEFG